MLRHALVLPDASVVFIPGGQDANGPLTGAHATGTDAAPASLPPDMQQRRLRAGLLISRLTNLLSAILILGAWWMLTARAGNVSSWSPVATWDAFLRLTRSSYLGFDLFDSVAVSTFRVLSGWVLSLVFGIAIGCAMGLNRHLRAALDPWVGFVRCLPPLGYMCLVILWAGVGFGAKMVVLTVAGVPPIALGTAAAIVMIRPERVEGARSLGLHGWRLFRYVVLPSALPGIVISARVGFGVVFSALLGAEIVATPNGIAGLTVLAVQKGEMPVVLCGIIIMGFMAIIFDSTLRWAGRRLTPWHGRA